MLSIVDASDADKSELLNAKIILLCLIGFSTFAASLLPWLIQRKFKNAVEMMTIAMSLAGGVILGSGLSHLLPQSISAWNDFFAIYSPHSQSSNYPFAELVAGFIMLLLLSIDQLAVSKGLSGDAGHNHMVIDLPTENLTQRNSKTENATSFSSESASIFPSSIVVDLPKPGSNQDATVPNEKTPLHNSFRWARSNSSK